MGKKTISIDFRVYNRLRSLKRQGESFSETIDRLTLHLEEETNGSGNGFLQSEHSWEQKEKLEEQLYFNKESLTDILATAELISCKKEARKIQSPLYQPEREGEYPDFKVYPCYQIVLKLPRRMIKGDTRAIGYAFREIIGESILRSLERWTRSDTAYSPFPRKSLLWVIREIIEKTIENGDTLDSTDTVGSCSFNPKTSRLKFELFCDEDVESTIDEKIDLVSDYDLGEPYEEDE